MKYGSIEDLVAAYRLNEATEEQPVILDDGEMDIKNQAGEVVLTFDAVDLAIDLLKTLGIPFNYA